MRIIMEEMEEAMKTEMTGEIRLLDLPEYFFKDLLYRSSYPDNYKR